MFVKPAPGVKVRDPRSKLHLPEGGKEVPATTYWLRRLAAGDVVEADRFQIPDSSGDEVKS
jgi:hypothetical protein